ncbi:MAG: 3-deoxy-7-phosphoheptulonate synthase [Verrucomicrobiales bacterium]
MLQTHDLRVRELVPLVPPRELKVALPVSTVANTTVFTGRQAVENILTREDDRMLVVIGPCSIHDPEAALDYARRLRALAGELEDRLFVVMRVYFEKPRTTVGWKGLINDPQLDGTHDIQTGLRLGREVLLRINELGLPAATEFLDPIVPQYHADLVTWAAIGARTTESQTHREMASGLSMPVGFKNATDGSLQVALDAMRASMMPHSFLGIDQDGRTSIVRTTGNPFGHVVLRGGRARSNYDPESIASAVADLRRAGLPEAIMVDCSHANSNKQHARQEEVWQSVVAQRVAGNRALIGLMVESHLHEGAQPIPVDLSQLAYGVSVTDACIGWETTERMLRHAHRELGAARGRALVGA